jgi:ATP-dependent Clp protease adaptor protein ClpS
MIRHCEERSDEAIQLDGSPRLLSQASDDLPVAETKTKKNPRSVPAPQTRLADVWRVVVLNDPVNRMSYVVMVLRRVFGFAEERARKHMLEVHEQGRSVLWSGTREQAEAYVFALQQWHLTAVVQATDS